MISIVLIGALGFLLPLTFARRITLVGLVVSLSGFGLATLATLWTLREFGVLPATAAAFTVNIAVAGFWFWLVFRVTTSMHREKPGA